MPRPEEAAKPLPRGGPLRGGTAAALLCVVAAGCGGDCLQSADVRLEIQGPAAQLSLVKRLIVGIAVNGGARQVQRLDLAKALESGGAILLQPSASISGTEYAIAIDVAGLDETSTTVAFGQTTQNVGTHACNRVQLALGGGDDMGVADLEGAPDLSSSDLAGADLSISDLAAPDLAPCTATTPDEDGDGRGDVCDVCAANANPTITDGDGDGVPDVCDPAPAAAGNQAVYFEPFAAQGAWSGVAVSGGYAEISGTADAFFDKTVTGNNATVNLPAGVWMQTLVTPTDLQSGIYDGGVRVVLWDNINAAGYICTAELHQLSGANMSIRDVGHGNNGGTGANLTNQIAQNQAMRIRMWVHGLQIGCEVAKADGSSAVTVTRAITAAPAGPLHPGLGVGFDGGSNPGSVTARYTSVFAVSYP